MRTDKIFLVCIVVWLVLPAGLVLLYSFDSGRGLIWFFLHQLYYAPFGTWLHEPFFAPDSEVGFWVQPLGRILSAAAYAFLLCGARVIAQRVMRIRSS